MFAFSAFLMTKLYGIFLVYMVYKGFKLNVSEYFFINQHDSNPTPLAIYSFITKL